MGAVQGWAASIRFNPTLAAQFEAYPPSAPSSRLQPPLRLDQDTLTVGLCCLVSVPAAGRRLHMGAAKLAACAPGGPHAQHAQEQAVLRKAAPLQAFKARQDTFSLGVCNGCQLMALLGWVNPKASLSVCLSTVRCATARTATFAEALCDARRLPAARKAHTRLAWRLCAARPRPFVSETDRRCLCAVARSGASCTT
jgi:hypothetical protein